MRLFLPVAFLLLLLTALPLHAEDTPSISTVGTASIYVVPDKATVSVSIESVDKDIDVAKSQTLAKATKFIATAKANGIADADLATDRLSAGPHYRREVSTTEQDGFSVSRSYVITVKDLTKLEPLIDALLKGGLTSASVDLQVTDMRKYRDQARQLAIHAALEKARLLAKELDTTVGKPRKIEEVIPNPYASFAQNSSMGAPPAPADTPDTLPLGKIEVQASIAVTFELK